MSNNTSNEASGESVDLILAAFEQSIDADAPTGYAELLTRRQELIEQHPRLAEQLRAYFADVDVLDDLLSLKQPESQDVPQPAGPVLSPGEFLGYLGDYQILGRLSHGGMGIVYKARQMTLDRIVAVKLIRRDQPASARERFRREALTMAGLAHPHIVGIHEVQEHSGWPYFSMEYIGGGSLASRLREGMLPPREAAKLLWKISQAVSFAHERGVLHRDLKPANILLDEAGEPHVTDFGLARQLESESDLTLTGVVPGTPAYMSPEQIRGDKSAVSTRSDQFSLGVILYQTLTGELPFAGGTPFETQQRILHDSPRDLRAINPAIPLDLATVCQRCLEKDPQRRLNSCRELSDCLEDFLANRPIPIRPIGQLERAWRWCRRNKSIAALTACLLATLIVGATISTVLAIRYRETSETLAGSVGRFADLSQEKSALADQYRDLSEELEGSVERLSKLSQVNGDLAENYRQRSEEAERRARINHLEKLSAFANEYVDRDARLAALLVSEAAGGLLEMNMPISSDVHQCLRRVSASLSGIPVGTSGVLPGQVRVDSPYDNHCFSRDGMWLTTADEKQAKLWDLRNVTFSMAPVAQWLLPQGVSTLEFSPDGRWLYFNSRSRTACAYLAEISDRLIIYALPPGSVGFSPDSSKLAVFDLNTSLSIYDLTDLQIDTDAHRIASYGSAWRHDLPAFAIGRALPDHPIHMPPNLVAPIYLYPNETINVRSHLLPTTPTERLGPPGPPGIERPAIDQLLHNCDPLYSADGHYLFLCYQTIEAAKSRVVAAFASATNSSAGWVPWVANPDVGPYLSHNRRYLMFLTSDEFVSIYPLNDKPLFADCLVSPREGVRDMRALVNFELRHPHWLTVDVELGPALDIEASDLPPQHVPHALNNEPPLIELRENIPPPPDKHSVERDQPATNPVPSPEPLTLLPENSDDMLPMPSTVSRELTPHELASKKSAMVGNGWLSPYSSSDAVNLQRSGPIVFSDLLPSTIAPDSNGPPLCWILHRNRLLAIKYSGRTVDAGIDPPTTPEFTINSEAEFSDDYQWPVCFSRNGRWLAITVSGGMQLIDLAFGRSMRYGTGSVSNDNVAVLKSRVPIAFSGDSRYLLTRSDIGELRLYRVPASLEDEAQNQLTATHDPILVRPAHALVPSGRRWWSYGTASHALAPHQSFLLDAGRKLACGPVETLSGEYETVHYLYDVTGERPARIGDVHIPNAFKSHVQLWERKLRAMPIEQWFLWQRTADTDGRQSAERRLAQFAWPSSQREVYTDDIILPGPDASWAVIYHPVKGAAVVDFLAANSSDAVHKLNVGSFEHFVVGRNGNLFAASSERLPDEWKIDRGPKGLSCKKMSHANLTRENTHQIEERLARSRHDGLIVMASIRPLQIPIEDPKQYPLTLHVFGGVRPLTCKTSIPARSWDTLRKLVSVVVQTKDETRLRVILDSEDGLHCIDGDLIQGTTVVRTLTPVRIERWANMEYGRLEISPDARWLAMTPERRSAVDPPLSVWLWDLGSELSWPVQISDANFQQIIGFSHDSRWLILQSQGALPRLVSLEFPELCKSARCFAGRSLTEAERKRFGLPCSAPDMPVPQ